MTIAQRATALLLAPPLFLLPAAITPQVEEVELDEAEVFVEFNSTDGDFGIQFFWDGDAWDRMKAVDPEGRAVMKLKIDASLREQGLTEGFYESDEPSTDELSMEEFFERFPEGPYLFEGRTLDHERLVGETEFTHVLPAAPTGLSPGEGEVIDAGAPLVLSFDAVTQDLGGNPLEPELYEVVLEVENDILRVLSMTVEGDVAAPQVTVPPEFLTADTEYKLEVIVQEESGNRTISETTFTSR